MKNLLYKELKLAMHPICYVFIFLFPLMIFIANYPIGVMFIYLISTYPILFLGANRGQQSNDLLYSALLPIRKRDIVKARIFTCLLIQFSFLAVCFILLPFAISSIGQLNSIGYGVNQFLAASGFAIIGLGVVDIIYFAFYYKNGKSIVASSIISALAFTVFILVFTTFLPMAESLQGFFMDVIAGTWLNQIIFFLIALAIAGGLNYAAYRVGAKQIEKVDF